jgi:hypothetical protein
LMTGVGALVYRNLASNNLSSLASLRLPEKVYATLNEGVLTIYTILKDGKSKRKEVGLYGAAIGLVSPELIGGMKHCFRVVNGIEEMTLQTTSHDDTMDWATSITQGISMENGGGLLLDKAKKDAAPSPSLACNQPSSFPSLNSNDDVASSIVFAKQVQDDVKVPTIAKSKSLDSIVQVPMPLLKNNVTVKPSRSCDLTELDATFKTLDPVDLSETMLDFANNFFTNAQEAKLVSQPKAELPLQALRGRNLSRESIESDSSGYLDMPWLEIDKASSAESVAMSDEELVDKYLDLDASDTHLNVQDFKALLRYNEEGQKQSVDTDVFGLV